MYFYVNERYVTPFHHPSEISLKHFLLWPWWVWPGWLEPCPVAKRLWVRFQVRAHAWLWVRSPGKVHTGGRPLTDVCLSPSRSPALPRSDGKLSSGWEPPGLVSGAVTPPPPHG